LKIFVTKITKFWLQSYFDTFIINYMLYNNSILNV